MRPAVVAGPAVAVKPSFMRRTRKEFLPSRRSRRPPVRYRIAKAAKRRFKTVMQPSVRVSSVSMANLSDSYRVVLAMDVRKDFPWEVLDTFFEAIKVDPDAFLESITKATSASEGFALGLDWANAAQKKKRSAGQKGKKKR